jgi:hypothetical protein
MTFRAASQRAVTPQGRGRFPGFDVLDQSGVWDDVTAGVVLARLGPPNDLGFFTQHERAVAEPLLDLLLAQDREPRVPVLALIDTRSPSAKPTAGTTTTCPRTPRRGGTASPPSTATPTGGSRSWTAGGRRR